MGKFACGLAVELDDIFHAESAEQLRDYDTANRVDSVDGYRKVGLGYGICVHKLKSEHLLDVTAVVGVVYIFMSEIIDFGKGVFAAFGYAQHLFALCVVEKFAFLVEELEGVPLLGVVAGCDDDASDRAFLHYSYLCCRSRGQTDVDHIHAHGCEGAGDEIADHGAAQTCVATHYDGARVARGITADKCCVSGCKLYNVQRREAFAGCAAYGAAYTGNRLDE